MPMKNATNSTWPIPMQATVPERDKKSGVCYAVTDDGLELPVIDITHPAFELRLSEAEISAVIDDTLRSMQASASLPAETARGLVEGSLLLRGVRESAGTFMSGMMTYLHRLGPENLGSGYANDVDRRFAASMMPLSFRLRLRDMARLLADGLIEALDSSPRGNDIELISIAGGPAMESLNALILVRKSRPELLRERAIGLRILDIDSTGPSFGARATQALVAEGAPLCGQELAVEHVYYDWNDTEKLRGIFAGFSSTTIAAGSTEGGLFDYGSDEVIVRNLSVLREVSPAGFFLVGSVVRDVESLDPRLRMTAGIKGRPAIRYLGEKAFHRLASEAGWRVDMVRHSTAHHVIRLKKQQDG